MSVSDAPVSLWRAPGMRSLVYLGVLAFASFFLTLSSLPLYAIAIGTSAGAAGLVTTVMLVSTVTTQTLVPVLVSRFGLVEVLAAGLVLLGAPAPLYLLADQFWWVLVVSALRGVGFAVITVLMPLAASRLVPLRRRGEAIGIYGLAIAIPNLIAVPGGVAVTSAGHFGWVAVAAVTPVLALPLLPSIARSLRPPETSSAGATSAAPTAALRAVSGSVVVLLVVTLSGGGVLTFLPVARPTGALATIALLVFGATGALARWRAGVLSDRIGEALLLPMAVLISAVGMVLLAVGLSSGTSATVLVGAAAFGIGYGSVQNVTLIVAFNRAGPDHQATASAAWNAAYDAGTAIGALAVGLVATSGPGFGWTFAGCALLITVTLVPAITVTRASAQLG